MPLPGCGLEAGRRRPCRARRWRQRMRRSLGARLVLLFLLLALATTAIFLFGMQRALSGGWSGVRAPAGGRLCRPAGRRHRLAARRGARAGAGAAPAAVGAHRRAAVHWDSHPQRRAWHREPRRCARRGPLAAQRAARADGHRIVFGLGDRGWATRPRTIGWVTLAALLLLTAAAYGYVRHLFRPLDDIRAGALRFGQGHFERADPGAPARRAGRPGRAGQHHGARHPRHARRQARPAAGDQPRAALAADARAPERRTGGAGRARATRCCATWARCAT